MVQKHPFRSKLGLPNGTRGLFCFLPFDGVGKGDGLHHFSDHGHARNFIRYLFSQSQAHPRTSTTARNLFRIYKDGALASEAYNNDPPRHLADFMANGSFPKSDAHLQLCDDGCYPLFVFRYANGPLISNVLSRSDEDQVLEICHPFFGDLQDYLASHGHDWATDERLLGTLIREKDELLAFDDLNDGPELRQAEALIQIVARRAMGRTEQTIMTVAHRDQENHNPIYHIHRLLRRVAV
jgi:hypothetical protein